VGVRGSNLVLAVAIAWAESGLRTDAVGWNFDPVTGERVSVDRGIWQINSAAHPDVTEACAFDPPCNARAMFRISNSGTNWRPWTTFNTGAFNQFFLAATVAVKTMLGETSPAGPNDPIKNTLDYIKAGGSPLNAAVRMFQYLMDGAMDAKYGPGHRTGPVLGNIIK